MLLRASEYLKHQINPAGVWSIIGTQGVSSEISTYIYIWEFLK